MKVNEIFYSVQGEGYHTGMAATFIRLSGCNLKCEFCDTQHQQGTEMLEQDIVSMVKDNPSTLVVITGGEPALQLTKSLVDLLHKAGKYVAVETNGTKELPDNVDWVTVSPKQPYVGHAGAVVLKEADEVKVVFDGREIKDPTFGIKADHYYVQPCDTGFAKTNNEINEYCINFVKRNPLWKISLQTQKILNVL